LAEIHPKGGRQPEGPLAEPALFGDTALRFELPRGAHRRRLFDALAAVAGVTDVVLAEEVGCVVFDDEAARATIAASVAHALAEVTVPAPSPAPTRHAISVVYDGEDLDAVASAAGRSREAVIGLHAGAEYEVAMLGFLPGFAYLRGLPAELVLPRRAPRPRVPPGSVAIAAEYTGIYPFASPGGWHLLGRAVGFTPFGPDGAALALGDSVRFTPTTSLPPTTATTSAETEPAPTGPHLELTRVQGFALLVDGGRPGRMHQGIPRGGPLVRSLFARANALAANDGAACAIEVNGTLEVTARIGPVTVADADARVVLAPGDRLVVSTAGRARAAYLAVAGGIDAGVVLGGRGALLVAGIGRLLRKGDRLTGGPSSGRVVGELPPPPALDAPIEVSTGPDAALLDALLETPFRIAMASDRTGTRLDGLAATVPSGDAARRSTPMVPGAIELTPSGPIVLGPDHPTTGGYPVVAVVRSSSLDDLFFRPVGSPVRFRLG
jgi:KipI family sensor histidine kinase inhibitor